MYVRRKIITVTYFNGEGRRIMENVCSVCGAQYAECRCEDGWDHNQPTGADVCYGNCEKQP